jgi:sigma-E factor negative regulatory protein RseA
MGNGIVALGFRTDLRFRSTLLDMAGSIMDTHARLYENISALADGELAASELELAFAALDTPAGRQAWDAYQHIGHALRSAYSDGELSAGFEARLAHRLAGETAQEAEAGQGAPASAEAGSLPQG